MAWAFSRPSEGWSQVGKAMRNTYLVCYDIRDDKRLRTVYKTIRDFGNRSGYSKRALE